MDDVICLAVAHRFLGHEGFRRVVEMRGREYQIMGSWAGKRVITAGHCTFKLPKGMLTAAEDEKMCKHRSGFGRLMNTCHGVFDPVLHTTICAERDGDVIKPALQRVAPSTGDCLRVRLLLEDTTPRYASDATWALINLDRKMYIRANALANRSIRLRSKVLQPGSSVEGPFVRGEAVILDLASLALVLTAWSHTPFMEPVGRRGPWAGQRIGIYKLEEFAVEELKDVSAWGLKLFKGCIGMIYHS